MERGGCVVMRLRCGGKEGEIGGEGVGGKVGE